MGRNLMVVAVAAGLLFVNGCKQNATPPAAGVSDFEDAMAVIKEWTASLKDAPASEVRRRLAPAEPKETTWTHDEQTGPMLEYNFEQHDIEFYFVDGRLIMVSLDVFTE